VAAAVEDAQQLQEAQAALIVLLLSDLDVLWDRLDEETLDMWIEAAAAVIEEYAVAMGALAQEMYEAARDDAGVDSEFDLAPIEPPERDQIEAVLRWATSEMWSGGSPEDARDNVEAGAEKLVLDTGRQTAADASVEDPAAQGWARIARPNACYFCRMLATRGGVYSDSDTALIVGPGRERSGERYHDNCRCLAVPVFEGETFQPPGYVREWTALWKSSTKGKSGKAAINAFRRAIYPEHKGARNARRRELYPDQKDAINARRRQRYARRRGTASA